MKTTAFKIFALCVAIVCLASSPVTRAAPILKSGPGTSENPIVEKQSIDEKNLVRLNFVDLESHDSRLIANEEGQKPAMTVHEPKVSHNSHRQLRSYDPKVEEKLRRELEGENSSISVDSKEAVPVLPDPSNEIQDSQQSSEAQNSQSSEAQNSQSSEAQNSQSSEAQDSTQSNEDSDYKHNYTELPTPYGSNESYDPEDISNESSPNDDDLDESDTIKPASLL